LFEDPNDETEDSILRYSDRFSLGSGGSACTGGADATDL